MVCFPSSDYCTPFLTERIDKLNLLCLCGFQIVVHAGPSQSEFTSKSRLVLTRLSASAWLLSLFLGSRPRSSSRPLSLLPCGWHARIPNATAVSLWTVFNIAQTKGVGSEMISSPLIQDQFSLRNPHKAAA